MNAAKVATRAAVAFCAALALVLLAPMSSQAAWITWYSGTTSTGVWRSIDTLGSGYYQSHTVLPDLVTPYAAAYTRIAGLSTASAPLSVYLSFSPRQVSASCKWEYPSASSSTMNCELQY